MKQKEVPFQSLFFKVQPVAEKKPIYDPVQRKIIDVSIYERDQLLFSSVASVYLYQEKHDMLVEERKQQKQSLLRTERPLLSFPVPRLPRAFVQQIRSQPIRNALLEYLDMLPPQLQVKATQQCEEQPFYQRLDQNQVPNVQTVFPNFPSFYRNLCKLYVATYGDKNAPMDDETVDGLNFYRFMLQIPYIPPFSIWSRPVVKNFRYTENQALKTALKEVLKVETLQQSLQVALTRRWQRDIFSRHIDGEDIESEQTTQDQMLGAEGAQAQPIDLYGLTEVNALLGDLPNNKSFQNSTDLLLSHVFQLTKLLINCNVVPMKFSGTLYSLFLGSQCYNFHEIKHFLIKKDGFMRWIEHKNEDLTNAFKAGATAKVIAAIEAYADAGFEEGRKLQQNIARGSGFNTINGSKKQKQTIGDDESDMLAVDTDKHSWDGLNTFLIMLTRLLKVKQVNQPGFILRAKGHGISVLNKLLDCKLEEKSYSLANQCLQQLQKLG